MSTKNQCKCGKLKEKRSKSCLGCSYEYDDLQLKDAIYHKHNRAAAFSLVRWRAKIAFKQTGITKCQKCSYDKHIEICHIKPISTFPLETMLSEINDLKNLIGLCPNCHWEHDFGQKKVKKETYTLCSCGDKKDHKAKSCYNCYQKSKITKIQWPTKEELEKLVWEKPMIKLAGELNISDKSIKTRCNKLNIQIPPQGYWIKKHQ